MRTMRVYKYGLKPRVTRLEMPEGADVLYVDVQANTHGPGVPTIWALVDIEQPLVERSFGIAMTGENLPAELGAAARANYVGSFQIAGALGEGSPFVGHVFELASDLAGDYPQPG